MCRVAYNCNLKVTRVVSGYLKTSEFGRLYQHQQDNQAAID